MTVFDFAAIGVIVLSGFFAYFRGFVREALSIAAWIAASFVALYALPYVAPLFEKALPRGVVANSVAAAVVFLVALMVLHMISSALARRVKDSALSPVDRTLGLVFGLARGTIIVCLGYLVLAMLLPPGKDRPRWFADARSLPYLEAGAGKLEAFIPELRSARPRSAASGISNSAEREAERAINAFRNPFAGNPTSSSTAAPAYTPQEQRDLNRLIQQQNAK